MSVESENNMIKEKKIYLTKEKLREYQEERHKLQKLHRHKIQKKTPVFLHSEEVSPEYLCFQEDIAFLEARLVELENILKNVELIKAPPQKERDKITLGATVQVKVDGKLDEFMLVGTLEANPLLGKISNESPVGEALIGKKVGEIVFLSFPVKIKYEITQIKYEF